jgi:hypothetical protein
MSFMAHLTQAAIYKGNIVIVAQALARPQRAISTSGQESNHKKRLSVLFPRPDMV